jgi:uncharacterized damage-inducible protein DinB
MIENRPWFERHFELGLPPEVFPGILERLRGTPARLEERLLGTATGILVRHWNNKWSIQEHAGHLWDLEPLWVDRLNDLLAGAPELKAADLQNRKTHEARHDARPLQEILAEFRRARSQLVSRLENLTAAQLQVSALHPRLRLPMTAVDLFLFVAEHDDHHLSTISGLLRTFANGAGP